MCVNPAHESASKTYFMVRYCLEIFLEGLFDSASSGAKVVAFMPSSGSGRCIFFHQRLDMSNLT